MPRTARPPCTPLPCSDDSAARRAKAAAARLRDYGEEEEEAGSKQAAGPAAPAAPAGLLPSAAVAFTKVEGPPAFLDPEVCVLVSAGGTSCLPRGWRDVW